MFLFLNPGLELKKNTPYYLRKTRFFKIEVLFRGKKCALLNYC